MHQFMLLTLLLCSCIVFSYFICHKDLIDQLGKQSFQIFASGSSLSPKNIRPRRTGFRKKGRFKHQLQGEVDHHLNRTIVLAENLDG